VCSFVFCCKVFFEILLFGWIQCGNDVVYNMPGNVKNFNSKVISSALGYDFRQPGSDNKNWSRTFLVIAHCF
jgi:hypothetical protein